MKNTNRALTALLMAVASVILTGCASTDIVRVLSYYGDRQGVTGGQRPSPHTGVDFDAMSGAPVLAAADGIVVYTGSTYSCGIGVRLQHMAGSKQYFTTYCHLSEASVKWWQDVKRGDPIGKVGTTGRSMGVPHLHFEVCEDCYGKTTGQVDPMPFIVGCFDPSQNETYAALAKNGKVPRLILTYPVSCPAVAAKKRKV